MAGHNRAALIALVTRIKDDPANDSIDRWLDELQAAVPDPNVSDLIFWDDLSPVEIVDRALAYEVLALGSPPSPGD
ncbi:hypothetical protein [Gordonia sp. CPCC 205333]|uniref:hypothetical protein n=1 Tax=Gordonia sp. CPCC 205333 TaxID=3140790 RepID=UPI003AF380D5